jgi:hypothetical protein
MCDITAGAQGTIDTVDVYLNHGKTPVATIPVQVTKGSGQAPRKYPFAGAFSSSVSLTAAVGPNTFTLQVRDKVIGKVGSAEIVMECRPDGIADASPSNPAPGGLTSIEQPLAASVDLSGLDPAALLAGTASIPMSVAGLLADASPTATGGLTRKAKSLNGLVFAGNGMSMTVDEAGLRAALDGSAQEFSAIIDYPGMTSQPRTMVLRRNAAGKFETDVYSMEFNAPAGLEGTAPFDVTVRRGLNGPAVTATMVRDGMGWRSSDGALTMSTVLTTGPDGLRGVTASVTSSALGMSGVTVQAVESAAGNGTFGTQYVMSVGYDGEGGGTLHAQKPDLEWQDDSEKFQALALEIEGPASILESPDFKVQIRSGDRKAVKIGDKYFLANETGSDRDTLVLLPRSESVVDPQTTYFDNIMENPVARSGAFLGGFLVGFAGGGCDLVSSTGKLVGNAFIHAGASLWWWFPNTPTGQYARDIVQGNVATVYSITSNTASAIVGVLSQVQARRDELEAAIVTGDRAKLKEIAGEYADLFEIGSDLVLNVIDAYADLDPYEQGKAMGHVTFELVTVVAPFAKAGKLGERTKATAVANVVNAIRAAPWLTKLAEGTRARLLAAVSKTETFITKLATTKMCFVAGTPIKTASGWQPIESIRPGDLVWSKCPETGMNACRAVVSTVVTHPTALHHIVYMAGNARRAHAVGAAGVAGGEGADDPPGITSELVCTGEHPFCVGEVGDFVEARSLQIGQHLILTDGASATVIANVVEVASDGQIFTTYNFEVAEFHTYFAGEGGVWVHNAGRECERIATLYNRMRVKDLLSPLEAMKRIHQRLPGVSNKAISNAWGEAMQDLSKDIKFLGSDEVHPLFGKWRTKSGLQYDKNVEILPNGTPADNRVQHVLYHSVDDPARVVGSPRNPMPHGVFDAGQEGALDVIDEAFERVQSLGLQPVSIRGANRAYLVPMGRRVGFEGGVYGGQTGNQACTNVLLVIKNESVDAGKKIADVITAYPQK